MVANLHAEIRQKFILSNDTYKLLTDAHRKHREYNEGGYVILRICPKRYSKHAIKKYMSE